MLDQGVDSKVHSPVVVLWVPKHSLGDLIRGIEIEFLGARREVHHIEAYEACNAIRVVIVEASSNSRAPVVANSYDLGHLLGINDLNFVRAEFVPRVGFDFGGLVGAGVAEEVGAD